MGKSGDFGMLEGDLGSFGGFVFARWLSFGLVCGRLLAVGCGVGG
jgi:hypothetical protein